MPEMMKKSAAQKKSGSSTQRYLNVAAIKENTIVVRDGSLRAVIAVSSTNFSLKSEEEQNALTNAYQSFLNSLDFPIQILVRSRILDINSYLEKLRGLTAAQTNELLRIQMTEYIEYVGKLVEFANIMSKSFYIIVPYSANPVQETFVSRVTRVFNPASGIVANQESFERAKVKLEERINHVVSQLSGMGLRSMVLATTELVELLYQSYNVDSAFPLHADDLEQIPVSDLSK